jgi:hypothetical protein
MRSTTPTMGGSSSDTRPWGQSRHGARSRSTPRGFRAEYASVIALAREPSRSTGPPERLREAARRYGVRLLSLADLEAEASEFALPLPDDVLPKLDYESDRVGGRRFLFWRAPDRAPNSRLPGEPRSPCRAGEELSELPDPCL